MKTKNGTPGCGIGHMPNVMPMARGTTTKNKRQKMDRRDRKEKARGWAE